jgi:quercetin dioxygenase-like cupin family protein
MAAALALAAGSASGAQAGAPAPATRELLPAVELENDRIRVLRLKIEPGAEMPEHDRGAVVAIALTDLRLRVMRAGGREEEVAAPAGDVSWSGADRIALKNVGAETAELLVVEVKGSGAGRSLDPGPLVDPAVQSVEIQNARVRVLRNRYLPGRRLGTHSHPPRVAIPLTDLHVRDEPGGGAPREVRAGRGRPVYFPLHVTHALVNLAAAPLEVIEVELLDGP